MPDSAATAAPAAATATGTPDAAPAAGEWRPLFDGKTLAGWHDFKKPGVTTGWEVVDGAITRVGQGGDLLTDDEFANFELELEWNVAPGGNSGVMFRVDESGEQTYHTGPEMQVLDDARHGDGRNRLTSAGAAYGLYAVPEGVVKPAGQWNAVRLVANGAHIEHWLNGQKVVEYELWSPDWEAKVKGSKFVEWPNFGRVKSGRIALQDHGDRVQFRNIRIRVLP
jgi:hypothetical protein